MRRLLSGVAVGAAVILFTFVPVAAATVVQLPGGQRLGVMPRAGQNPAALRGSVGRAHGQVQSPQLTPFANTAGNVQFNGGSVFHTSSPYLIFWQPAGTTTPISAASQALMARYLSDLSTASGTTDATYGVGRQYYDGGGYAAAGQSFSAGQAFVDTNPYPTRNPTDCPITISGFTTCVTDTQIQQELDALIAARALPTDGASSQQQLGPDAPLYYVVLPQSVDECYSYLGSPSCIDSSSGGFCAYHSSYVDGSSNVIYAIIPFGVYNFGSKGCQQDGQSALQEPNADPADTIVDNLSHESNEAVTDPFGTAWYSDSTGQEVADNCETYNATSDPASGYSPNAYIPLGGDPNATPVGTLYDQLVNGDRYYTQSTWSNGQADCVMRPTAATLTPSFSVAGQVAAGQSVTADPSATASAAGVASETWSWGDGSTSFTPGGLSTATHSFAAAGQYTVKLTVVDVNGNLASATQQVDVGSNPTAVIGSLPASAPVGAPVSFSGSSSSDPNAGATTSYSWNFGDGAGAAGAAASHSFASAGTYTVTLSVSDSYGFSASRTATITVVPTGKIKRVRSAHTRGSAYVLVTVTQAGSLGYGRATRNVAANGTAKFRLELKAKQRRLLKRGKHFRVSVRVTYTQRGGQPVTRTLRVRL